jgi:hypothetical protein
MDNVHNCDGYINIPSSQTYRSCLPAFFLGGGEGSSFGEKRISLKL